MDSQRRKPKHSGFYGIQTYDIPHKISFPPYEISKTKPFKTQVSKTKYFPAYGMSKKKPFKFRL